MRYAIHVTRLQTSRGLDSGRTWRISEPVPYEGELAPYTLHIDQSAGGAMASTEVVTLIADTPDEARALARRYAEEERDSYTRVVVELTELIQKRSDT